jgi:hypothetical protein
MKLRQIIPLATLLILYATAHAQTNRPHKPDYKKAPDGIFKDGTIPYYLKAGPNKVDNRTRIDLTPPERTRQINTEIRHLYQIAKEANKKVNERFPQFSPTTAGTKKHSASKQLLDMHQSQNHNKHLQAEKSFWNKQTGSISKPDVRSGKTDATYDYKFGKTGMSRSQYDQYKTLFPRSKMYEITPKGVFELRYEQSRAQQEKQRQLRQQQLSEQRARERLEKQQQLRQQQELRQRHAREQFERQQQLKQQQAREQLARQQELRRQQIREMARQQQLRQQQQLLREQQMRRQEMYRREQLYRTQLMQQERIRQQQLYRQQMQTRRRF